MEIDSISYWKVRTAAADADAFQHKSAIPQHPQPAVQSFKWLIHAGLRFGLQNGRPAWICLHSLIDRQIKEPRKPPVFVDSLGMCVLAGRMVAVANIRSGSAVKVRLVFVNECTVTAGLA